MVDVPKLDLDLNSPLLEVFFVFVYLDLSRATNPLQVVRERG